MIVKSYLVHIISEFFSIIISLYKIYFLVILFHNTDRCSGTLFGDSQTFSQDEREARNLSISALGGRNRRLLDAVK